MPFSVSAAIGFIALFGIAVLDGQIMIAAIRGIREKGTGLLEAVQVGAKSRLTAVIATDMTDAIGFIPMALSLGVGAEVQRPLATVVVGGILTEMVMTLFAVPVIYHYWHIRRKQKST
jgi:cobalt-zinc-cadmium resistance protein CzcA